MPIMASYAELDGVEILSVGDLPERGIAFTKADLEEIARNTNQLLAERLHNPPGKLGHDDAQVFARESGLPATGWVDSVRVRGDKLVAKFREVPGILMRAFKEKLYRKISSEVYFGFKHPKTQAPMGKVLRAVAFLGADIPQVKGLADFLGEQRAAYSLAELDKNGEHSFMGEITITIQVPEATPAKGAPGPITAEGLAGTELRYYRESESIAQQLREQGAHEFEQDSTVESLLRYVGRVGPEVCASSPEFRQRAEDPESLCSWLQERARERGYGVIPLADTPHNEEKKDMDDKKKIEELEVKLTEAQSKSATSEQEATGLKAQVKSLSDQIAAERKKQNDGTVAAFIEKNKATITPAVEPTFRALCESAGEGEVEVKLSEGKVEKHSRLGLVMAFAETLIKAKSVPLGEAPGTGSGEPKKDVAVKGATSHVALHEQAMGLIEKNPKLSYKDAVNQAIKADPSLADA